MRLRWRNGNRSHHDGSQTDNYKRDEGIGTFLGLFEIGVY
jgi:hypothetical protein